MKNFSRLSRLLVSGFLIFCAATANAAGAPELVGKFGSWTSSRIVDGEQTVCYMVLTMKPPLPEKAKTKRGDIVLMITHRPADNSTDVVSYTAGVKFKPASEAVVTIGSKKFGLFTQGDTAWSRDVVTDHALAAAIRSAASLSMAGVSARNTSIADTLNLKGAFAAYAAINKACGLPVPEMPKVKPAAKKPVKTLKKKHS